MVERLIYESIPNTVLGNAGLLLVIVLSFVVLIKGADWLVEGAVEIAHRLGLPKIIIGATIVSLGTTSPEAAVSVMAALQGEPGLAIGNGVGSIICDLALILGLSMALSRIPMVKELLSKQAWVVFAAVVVLVGFAWTSPDQTIDRWMGFVMVGGLVVYLYISYRWARQMKGVYAEAAYAGVEEVAQKPPPPIWQSLLWLILGLGLLLGASHALIPSVTLAAKRVGVPEAVIAATLVALGTSLPELMTAISSIRKGCPEITLGNVMGADALNVLFVIGVSASAVPLRVEPVFYRIQAPVMLGLLVMFRLFIWTTTDHFRRWQGVLLLIGYMLFVGLQYIF